MVFVLCRRTAEGGGYEAVEGGERAEAYEEAATDVLEAVAAEEVPVCFHFVPFFSSSLMASSTASPRSSSLALSHEMKKRFGEKRWGMPWRSQMWP